MRKAAAERIAARARLDTLTPREFEVMQRIIAGRLNKQIADELGAAEKTIKIHRGRVMAKMEVISVADLVRVAQAGGVPPAAGAPHSWQEGPGGSLVAASLQPAHHG